MHEPYWSLRAEMLTPESHRDRAVLSRARGKLEDLMQYLENALGERPYFLGEFSPADIAIVPRALRMEPYGALPAPSLPRLNAWLERTKARPSVQRIL